MESDKSSVYSWKQAAPVAPSSFKLASLMISSLWPKQEEFKGIKDTSSFLFCLHTRFEFILLKCRNSSSIWGSAQCTSVESDACTQQRKCDYRVKVHIKGLYSADGWTLSRWTPNCGSQKIPDHTFDWIDAFVIMFLLLSPLQSLHVHIVPWA